MLLSCICARVDGWCTWLCSSSRALFIHNLSGERVVSTRAKLVKRCYLFACAPERLACSVQTLAHQWNLQELWLESQC